MHSRPIGTEKVSISNWPEILRILKAMKNPLRRWLLYGKTGTGKTTWAVSQSPDSELFTAADGQFADVLLGKYLLQAGSTVWANGFGSRAAVRGVPLILDELHNAPPELNSVLKAVLNDEAVCRLNLDNGETITPKQGYQVIATMNGSPDQLDDAVLDRFDVVLRCDTPHDGILRRLSPESAAFILNKMANEPNNDQWVPAITPRRMLVFEHLKREGISEELAAELTFGEGQGRTVLMAIVDAVRNKARV